MIIILKRNSDRAKHYYIIDVLVAVVVVITSSLRFNRNVNSFALNIDVDFFFVLFISNISILSITMKLGFGNRGFLPVFYIVNLKKKVRFHQLFGF